MELDEELLQIELTSFHLFLHDVLHQPRIHLWPQEEQEAVVARARAGDQQARDLLLCSCLSFIFHRGWRYKDDIRHNDLMDLISVGNLAMVEALEKALYADNPIKYLMSVGAYAITHCVFHNSPMITRGYRTVETPVVSLEEFSNSDLSYEGGIGVVDESDRREPERHISLYQALDQLTEKQREVVVRHVGLEEHAPTALKQISRELGLEKSAAQDRWQGGLKRLKKLLEPKEQ